VRTVSGKVEILVPRELRPATRLKSVSGRVQCDCEEGSDGEISVASISGKITVSSS
jgi:predicted membrane protein